jgi:hypothetical protein
MARGKPSIMTEENHLNKANRAVNLENRSQSRSAVLTIPTGGLQILFSLRISKNKQSEFV